MRSITPYDERIAKLIASLPGFTNYDEAEFVAWVDALVAIKRKRYEGDWRYDVEAIVRPMLVEAEKVRGRLARGEAQLRPMPGDGWVPWWARTLEAVFIRPFFSARPGSIDAGAGSDTRPFFSTHHGPADGGAGSDREAGSPSYSSSPPPSSPEPRVYVVPARPANEPEATSVEAKGDPGRPPLSEEEIRDQYAEILTLKARGFKSDEALANYLGCSETTIRRRRERGEQLLANNRH